MSAETWEWTDDPSDPCPLCVVWVETDPEDYMHESDLPMLPGGIAPRVYGNIHAECDAEVAQMVRSE